VPLADVDELEGFARVFLLAALRANQAEPELRDAFVEQYTASLDAGTNPGHPDAWPRIGHHDQTMVEATAVAVALHWSRPWLWGHLPGSVRERVVDWLGAGRTSWCADNNHVLLGATVQAFLASVGADHDPAVVDAALNRMDEWYAGDGWYSDGVGRRFDHYNAWTFHLYPFLIEQMLDGQDAVAAGRTPHFDVYRSRLRLFLDDYQHLFDSHGSPLVQGRSLIYRWATAAPFWMGELQGVSPLHPGRSRRLASGMLSSFVDAGAIDTGVLDLGWKRPAPDLLQAYNSAGSPLWASKGFLGLLLPSEHPAWTATEQPLQVEERDVLRPLAGPRWLAVGTRVDGITRVLNHGSDGHPRKPDKLYRRLAYSTATVPVDLDGLTDNSLAVGPRTTPSVHRGLVSGTVRRQGAASRWRVDAAGRDVTVDLATLVLGTVELRLARVSGAIDQEVRVTGWAVSSNEPATVGGEDGWASAATPDGLVSSLALVTPAGEAGVESGRHPNALGDHAAVPYARVWADESGQTLVAWLVHLGSARSVDPGDITVRWSPDGAFVEASEVQHHCAWVRERPWGADDPNQGVFRVGSAVTSC
jgi:hypothetical protein